jgi:hypothetical protein
MGRKLHCPSPSPADDLSIVVLVEGFLRSFSKFIFIQRTYSKNMAHDIKPFSCQAFDEQSQCSPRNMKIYYYKCPNAPCISAEKFRE